MSRRATEVYIDFIEQNDNGSYVVEGYVDSSGIMPSIQVRTRGSEQDVAYQSRQQVMQNRWGNDVNQNNAFSCTIIFELTDELRFTHDGQSVRINTNQFTRLASLSAAYTTSGKFLLRKHQRAITIRPKTALRSSVYELVFSLRLLGYWRFEKVAVALKNARGGSKLRACIKAAGIVAETLYYLPRNYTLRRLATSRSKKKQRPVWIISDRGMAAGDNGEALFRYIMQQLDVPADVYFVISKKSADYERMKAIGPVLDQESLRYKLYFLLADKIISSHADVEVTNPFLRQINHVVDLYNFDFIFLQHGITKDDVSSWLNRFNKNISLFVTAGKPEYQSILEYPYYYTKDNVLLSGFPRYDVLQNHPQNKIIIAPTYRADLLTSNTDSTGARAYDESFKKSEYFTFYNNLMNDPRIIETLERSRMTAELYLHPNFAAQIDDFTTNKYVTTVPYPYDYKQAFAEGSLLVTDYSSVAFDFAYLRKPVIYAQFDHDSFFAGHSYAKGYFSYERDGFGPVCNDYETIVRGILNSIDKQFRVNEVYRENTERFFAHNDTNNSKRVYDALRMV